MTQEQPHNPASVSSSAQTSGAIVSTGSETDPKATRLFKLLNRLASNEIQPYRRGKLLVFPFFVTDNHLKSLDAEIRSALKDIETGGDVDFVGMVRFQDLSSQRFISFSDFLDKAGKRRDPESVNLTWSKFSISEDGEPISGRVDLSFVTEKRLLTEKADPDAVHQSQIALDVSGSEQRWVDQLFEDLVPNLETTAHGGIMRPLWVFRNPLVVQMAALLLGWIAWIVESRFVGKLASKDFSKEKEDLLKKITDAKAIEQKFDLFANWLLTPVNDNTKQVIVQFLLGMGVFAAVYFGAKYLLPKLTPNSAVAIGLSSRRAISSIDTFKFIVFTGIVAGILLPMLFEILKWLW